ncbi:MAG TPA: hypothetical protein VHB47_16695 [Thermoanaerobaculia bacterium]|nr:hypothetical protein [Thermoanaerobaculia bacterium]
MLTALPMDKEAIRKVQEVREGMEYRDVDPALDYWVLQDNPCVVMLRRDSEKKNGTKPAHQRREGELWISFADGDSGEASAEFQELLGLTLFVQGMKLIYASLEALSPVRNLRRLSGEVLASVLAFSTDAQNVFDDRPRPRRKTRSTSVKALRAPDFQAMITDRATKARGILDQVISASPSRSDSAFRHIREVSISVMQALFSSPLVSAPLAVASLRRFSGRLLMAAAQFDGGHRDAIQTAAMIVAGATGEQAADGRRSGRAVGGIGEELMAVWSWCYFVAQTTSLRGGEPETLGDDRWLELAKRTTSNLAHCLWRWSVAEEERPPGMSSGDSRIGRLNTAHIAPWLWLWFCQQLLYAEIQEAEESEHSDDNRQGEKNRVVSADTGKAAQAVRSPLKRKRPGSTTGKWRFRADLAYVLRESIRVFLFGRRPDYRFQPAMLAKALRTLIEYHVLRIVCLPGKLDICGLLEIVGQAGPLETEAINAGHLQHIFEVYIAGHFLCGVALGDQRAGTVAPTPRRMLGLLTGQGNGETQELRSADFLKAFSLAALMHTTGKLLFPRWSREIEVLGQLDRRLRDQLRLVQVRLNSSATELAEACRQELMSAGYLTARADQGAIQWIDDKKEVGEPDLGLLSAWFCHRIGVGVESLEENVLRQAVRAVLFMRAGTQSIDPEADPVTALLLLCNEMFAWSPAATGNSTPEDGRRAAVLSAASPRNYRFRTIRIEGLRFRVDGTHAAQRFTAELTANGREATKGFPRFEIELAEASGSEPDFPFMAWIELAQSFGRIRSIGRSRGDGEDDGLSFRPALLLRSRRSADLKAAGMSCIDLLDELSRQAPLSVRPSLRRWLESAEIFVGQEHGQEVEMIEIRPQGSPWHPQDISPILPELDRLAKLIVKTRQADRQVGGTVDTVSSVRGKGGIRRRAR